MNKIKPIISDTEKAAIQCGNTHWEQNLFSNQLKWDKLLAVQSKPFSASEQSFIDNEVVELCTTFAKFGLANKTITQIKSSGFWSLNIPKKYTGLDFSAKAQAQILTRLSVCDVSLAVTVMVPNSLGPAELIVRYGSEQQKQDLLPKLASGEHVPCFALTSTNAGSDAAAMLDSGVVCYQNYQGKKTLGLRLNWDKRYTTLAPIATLIGLAFKTYDPDFLIGNKENLGISCALVDSSLAGVSIGRHHRPIGATFCNGPHRGKDVFIPMSALIGGQTMIGQGWTMLMESLSLGRGVSLPSLSLAGVELSLKTTLEYSLLRQQFKQPLYRFQGIAEKIVPMASQLLSMKAMSDFHLDLLNLGLNPAISSAILKYHHTELLRTNVNRAMDIHGGKTVMLGKSNYLANIYQTVPIAITVEGANILTRSMIIFGQGLMRCHPFLKDELTALEAENLPLFNQILGKHLAHILTVKIKSFMLGVSRGRLVRLPKNIPKFTKPYYQQLSSISASFAFLLEVLLIKYGSKVKFQESINGLFADLLMKMYSISTLLKYAQNLPKDFTDLTHWTLQHNLHESGKLLKDICEQFQFSAVFKIIALPRAYQSRPNITLQNQVINQLIHNSELKNTLTSEVNYQKNTILDKLAQAYTFAIKAEKVYKRVGYTDSFAAIDDLLTQQKINIDEHKLLVDLGKLRQQILAVDDEK